MKIHMRNERRYHYTYNPSLAFSWFEIFRPGIYEAECVEELLALIKNQTVEVAYDAKKPSITFLSGRRWATDNLETVRELLRQCDLNDEFENDESEIAQMEMF